MSTKYNLYHCASLVVSTTDIPIIVKEALEFLEEGYDERDLWIGIEEENRCVSPWELLNLVINK